MRLERTVTVDVPVRRAFDYLADFTTTTDWDPGTVETVRAEGDGGVGTTYRNRSRFLGRETALTYVVEELIPGERVRLRGENSTVVAVDTMTFRRSGSRTEVTYAAEFTFKGLTRLLAPLLKPAFARLGDQAAAGLRSALTRLARDGASRSPVGSREVEGGRAGQPGRRPARSTGRVQPPGAR